MLSYGGVSLCQPTVPVETWIARNFALGDIYQFARTHWHERTNGYYPVHPPEEHRPIVLNSLRWPVGASRWTVGHFLVTDNQLNRIRPLAYSRPPAAGGVISTVRYRSLPLVMYDGRNQQTNRIKTNLYMLPPRPLAKRKGRNGMYLLTLVDERFFWWSRSAQIDVTDTFTTWTQLYEDVADGLGITVTPDDIDSAYLRPSPALAQQYRFLPPLLDAVAYNVGQRVVRKLDGTVITQNARTARQQQGETTYTVMAGGEFALTKFPPSDAGGAIPKTVAVAFPEFLNGDLSPTPRVFAVDLTDIAAALPELSGAAVTGYDGTKFFRDTAIVCGCEEQGSYSGSLSGTNIPDVESPECNETELQLLANQVAEDFYLWHLGGVKDIKYAGVVNRSVEGLHDVEWRFRRDECSTRVQRAQPWLDTVTDFSHTASGGCGGLGPVTRTVTMVAETLCINGWLNVFQRAFTYIGGLLSKIGGAFLAHYAGCCDCGNASSEPVAPPDPPPDPPPYVVTDCCADKAIPTTLYALVKSHDHNGNAACTTANLGTNLTSYPMDYKTDLPVVGRGWVARDPLPVKESGGEYAGSMAYFMCLWCNELGAWHMGPLQLWGGNGGAIAVSGSWESVRAYPDDCDDFHATVTLANVFGTGDMTVEITTDDQGEPPLGNACTTSLCTASMGERLCISGSGFSQAALNDTYTLYRVTEPISGQGLVEEYFSQLVHYFGGYGYWHFVNNSSFSAPFANFLPDGRNGEPSLSLYRSATTFKPACTLPYITNTTNYNGTGWTVGTATVLSGDCDSGGGGGGCAGAPEPTYLGVESWASPGTHTVEEDALLIVSVGYFCVPPVNPGGNTATFAGQSMTLAKRQTTFSESSRTVISEIWYLVNNTGSALTGAFAHSTADSIDYRAQALTMVECLEFNEVLDTDSASGLAATQPQKADVGTLAATAANQYVHAAIVTLHALTGDADGTYTQLTHNGQDITSTNIMRLCEASKITTASGVVLTEKTGATDRIWAGCSAIFR